MTNKSKHYISEGAAIELLKRLFGGTDADALTLDEVYDVAGRAAFDSETNRNWLGTVMIKLKNHNLITSVYKFDGRKKLDRIQLTTIGKTVLGRTPSAANQVSLGAERVITPESVNADIQVLKRQNPSFEVGLIFHPKEQG